MRWFAFVLAAGLATSLMPGATLAQEQKRAPLTKSAAQQALSERLNQNTVTVISGNPNGTYLFFAYDMSAVLDDGDNLRVLPVVGKGAFQNVKDILHLRGVDLGITQSDIMSFLKKTPEFGPNIDDRMHYIAKLYNEEMHILAGPGINSIKDLDGKKVNYSDAGSGTQFSTRLIFEALGVKPQEVNMGQADGFLKVKSGEIAATVLIGGKPTAAFAKLQIEPGLKLLPVPYTEALETGYFPAKLSHEDYPGVIPEGQVVDTIAVGAILAVYAWPSNTDRYRRVAKFTEAFLGKFEEFRKPPRHAKWRETNISAPVKGWKRFQAAQEWIDGETSRSRQTSSVRIDTDLARKQAARAAPGDSNEQERLFQRFLEWSRQQAKQ
jgi:TRAP transporter TAXI family solute receptor